MPHARLTVVLDEPIGTISPRLHGHFAEHLGRCCNDGLWVGPESSIPNRDGLRTDVVDALARLGVPILRWPGGCYADTHHWRDGIGPRAQRPRTLGESCGLRVVEDNGLGTHEFIALCRQIGAEPYLAGNVGTGSPREMMDWVHYCNGVLDTTLVRERAANGHPEPMGVRFWGVGNENWGCGGNYDPQDYAKEFRRFATFLRMADPDIELVACGDNKRDWNLRVLETLRNDLRFLDHLSVHQYYQAGPAVGFTSADHLRLMRAGDLIEDVLRFTDEILRFFVAGRRQVGIAFDEWGVWHPEARGHCGYQAPNTLRDAVAAAGVLDVFHRWCRKVSMANLAQIVNVLQTLVETDGAAMWLTPTYHVFWIYRAHRGAAALRTDLEVEEADAGPLGHLDAGGVALASCSASHAEGRLAVSISNRSCSEPLEARVRVRRGRLGDGEVEVVSGDASDAVNSAARPDRVAPGPGRAVLHGEEIVLLLPPCSVATVVAPLAG